MEYINLHTHWQTNEGISIYNLKQNEEPDSLIFSSGIHPWDYNGAEISFQLSNIEKFARNKNCIAIGETGLDKNCKSDLHHQIKIFEEHVSISENLKKPLIIHCVKSYAEIINLKKNIKPSQTWIIHGFNKDKQCAESLLNTEILISIGSALYDKKSKVPEYISSLPLEKIFFETDDMNISIEDVYLKASKLVNTEIETLKRKIYSNFLNYFKSYARPNMEIQN